MQPPFLRRDFAFVHFCILLYGLFAHHLLYALILHAILSYHSLPLDCTHILLRIAPLHFPSTDFQLSLVLVFHVLAFLVLVALVLLRSPVSSRWILVEAFEVLICYNPLRHAFT